jgi:hypothetical protein
MRDVAISFTSRKRFSGLKAFPVKNRRNCILETRHEEAYHLGVYRA